MATFLPKKPIEADQFIVSDEQKDALKKRQVVVTPDNVQVKIDGIDYFGLVIIRGEHVKVEEGSYLVKENGSVVGVVKKDDFESSYSPVVEAAEEVTEEVPEKVEESVKPAKKKKAKEQTEQPAEQPAETPEAPAAE